MGEGKKDALRVNFDQKLKLEFHGVKVTSDAGLLAQREIDDVFGLTDIAYLRTDRQSNWKKYTAQYHCVVAAVGLQPLGWV